MYNPWLDSTLLAMQSGRVIALRALTLAGGGADAQAESERMVSEKLEAYAVAALTMMAGGSLKTVIAGYREVVQANADRLLEAAAPPTARLGRV